MRTAPCLDCCQRHEGCHSVCDLYKEYRANKDRIQKEVIEDNFIFADYLHDAINRMKSSRKFRIY